MAYERDIGMQWLCFSPTAVFRTPLRGSVGACYIIRGFCIAEGTRFTHSGGFSPLRGFVAPLSGADSTVAFRGLRTLRVLAHGYEKSRPAGGNAAARPIGSRRRDAPRHFLGRRRDAPRHSPRRRLDAAQHFRSRRRDARGTHEAAGGTHRGTPSAAGGTHRGTAHAAGWTPRVTSEAAGGTPGGMSVIMASDTPVCRGRRLPRRPCGPTITRPRCSPSCSKRRFHSSWRCSR